MIRGRFITVEGTEGVGKSTNMAFIADLLRKKGVPFIETREPGGTPLAEEIRELLLSPREETVDNLAELLLVFAARAQHLNGLIKPSLAAGQWVLSDRFTDATFAYQGGGRGLNVEQIRVLQTLVQGDLRPDCTVLLDAPIEVGMQRARDRGELDRFEQEKALFFEKVREAYHQQVSEEPNRFLVADAAQPLAHVQAQILDGLSPIIEGFKSSL